jgi:hypothetical protein
MGVGWGKHVVRMVHKPCSELSAGYGRVCTVVVLLKGLKMPLQPVASPEAAGCVCVVKV